MKFLGNLVRGKSISQLLVRAGGVLALFVLVLLAGAYRTADELNNKERQVSQLAIAMRTHVEMDMIHDAINSAVLASIQSGLTRDNRAAERARNEYAAYITKVNDLRDKIRGLELSDEIRMDMVSTSSSFDDYIKLAASVVEVGYREPQEAIRRKAAFDTKFAEMETANEAVSDRIETRVTEATASLESMLANTLLFVGIAAACLLAMIAGFIWFMRRTMVSPIERITAELARSEATGLPAEAGRDDEIGRLARSVNDFREAGERIRRSEAARDEAEREAAEQTQRKRALAATAEELEKRTVLIVEKVSATARQLAQVADALADSAGRSREETTAAAAAAEQTLGGVVAIAQATDELLVSIEEVSSRINVVAMSGEEARTLASSTETTISELNTMAGQISSFTFLIGEIAQRSNLLALNATIEAAHAGHAGSGFAVVADEVKQLANQTSRAVEEIEEQIRAITNVAQNATRSLASMAHAINELGSATTSIASAAEQQTMATGEIGRTIEMSSTGTEAMRGNLYRVEGQVSETASNAEAVRRATKELDLQADELRREMSAFLASAKAA